MVEASLVNFAELVVLAVGIVIALFQLRDIKQTRETELETRQAQLFMEIYSEYRNKEFQRNISSIYNIWEWKDYDDFQKKYGRSTNSEAYSSFASVNSYFEGMGLLVHRKYIDPQLVEDLIGGAIIRYWERIKPLTIERRERRDWPELCEWFEYLYDVIKPIRDKEKIELKT